MKANIFVAALLLFCLGCTSQQGDQLTQQQKDQIKNEVKVAVDSFFAKAERLDANGTLQYFWDSPEFVSLNVDGSVSDFQAAKQSSLDQINSVADLKMTWSPGKFTVLTKDFVICSLLGKAEISFKSGDKMTQDPEAVTWVFKKIEGQWKIIYSHESATITTQKPGKK